MDKIRVGVIGAGRMGQHHVRIHAEHPNTQLVAVADVNLASAQALAKKYKTKAIADYRELIGAVDAVSIAVPTVLHHEVASEFLTHGIHVLLEKPITRTVEEAESLVKTARKNHVILQVGHIERFNAAIQRYHEIAGTPVFIEAHRLGPFDPRVRDIGVVMDLMIHDLDIILHLVQSEVISIEAVGCPVLTDREDIANARLHFANGCIANLTASRITPSKKRKIRIFQPAMYVSIDYAKPAMHVYRLTPEPSPAPGQPAMRIKRTVERLKKEEPLKAEIDHFLDCVAHGKEPQVKGEHAQNALELAVTITQKMREDYERRTQNLHHSG
ncbi:MAG: Gfo/Idh/MocA family oxidoreductase [Candidatus Sumerlaeota bacterium]|nr:Gfo/Idh/MocA family oxidoreductase [Candidatus Sumerlaeota bacterium]